MSILKPKDMQKPQEPSARNGSGQSPRVSSGEGSLLGNPQVAGEKQNSMPSQNNNKLNN